MKLMLRPEWRLWPLSSFLGLLDLKTGVTIALLFVLLNKVAGIYGLIAMLTGSGGSFAQLSLYIYSVIALVGLVWGLRAVKEEDAKQTLYFAHIFFADHIVSTSWTVFFAVVWWVYTPHDGRRQANSEAQKTMMEAGPAGGNMTVPVLTDAQRKEAAMTIWNQEKGTAAAIIIASWVFKIYFALLLYSYANHLRKGSYRSLPLSRSTAQNAPNGVNHAYDTTGLVDDDDDEVEDFYRVPLRTHNSGNTSVSSMADFIAAPGRARKAKVKPSSRPGSRSGDYRVKDEEDVLFDETESTAYASSSRTHSKVGTDEASTSLSTDDERGSTRGGSSKNRD
ncbi:Inositolphosphorylceramide synthase subunit Kei1-domain-containing protein [Collybia nuda]|uniref:Inositolphosphorylceramide synthase subunit Kei1-domain-containing protein n=1 Tax=Collybia nuda TaxID=64659 RepID=A0A9P5Y639_9AGAR|nr:Inositolphosphorylceramide synthase subunit Kei1-domain-containing protein [Collybia nuda]